MRNSNFTSTTWRRAVRAAGLPKGLRIHDSSSHRRGHPHQPGRSPRGDQAVPRALLDHGGHLFPSEQALAEALDDALTQSQTDKRRTRPASEADDEMSEQPKGQATLAFPQVGPCVGERGLGG